MRSIRSRCMSALLFVLLNILVFFAVRHFFTTGMPYGSVLRAVTTLSLENPEKSEKRDATNREPVKKKQQTLLVTFGRSGSSFTSDIIAHNEEVFYTFEPLSFFTRPHERASVPRHLLTEDYEDFARRIIESYLTCSFDLDTLKSLANSHLRNSNSTKDFASCFEATNHTGIEHLNCYIQLVQNCTNHRMTLVKTIRFPVKYAKDLMARHPELKIIYLIRDPRATLHSQAKVFESFRLPEDIVNVSSLHCHWLGEDLVHLQQLRDKFPGRVKVVRYEHGVIDPQGYAAEIYQFLGLPVTQDLKELITYKTSPEAKSTKSKQSTKVEKHPMKKDSHELSFQPCKADNVASIKPVTKPELPNKKDQKKNEADAKSKPSNENNLKKKKQATSESEPKKKGQKKNIAAEAKSEFPNEFKELKDVNGSLSDRQRLGLAAFGRPPEPKNETAEALQELKHCTHANLEELIKLRRKAQRSFNYGTRRANPMMAMEHWRYELDFEVTRIIDSQCGAFYPVLGYRMLTAKIEQENTAEVNLVVAPMTEGII
ncbi:carbohydrate sulfotransferase 1-like [Elysia marginata]|uniref:Carbohydrate sulfotransferase 1-like n=1 Tax=Elysia marginata TaxID=1093978 RepID=A0AAV4EBM4_9GAST|nr:carbohydrate sulfotransferase 1-like [Elysia marginata]